MNSEMNTIFIQWSVSLSTEDQTVLDPVASSIYCTVMVEYILEPLRDAPKHCIGFVGWYISPDLDSIHQCFQLWCHRVSSKLSNDCVLFFFDCTGGQSPRAWFVACSMPRISLHIFLDVMDRNFCHLRILCFLVTTNSIPKPNTIQYFELYYMWPYMHINFALMWPYLYIYIEREQSARALINIYMYMCKCIMTYIQFRSLKLKGDVAIRSDPYSCYKDN